MLVTLLLTKVDSKLVKLDVVIILNQLIDTNRYQWYQSYSNPIDPNKLSKLVSNINDLMVTNRYQWYHTNPIEPVTLLTQSE